MECGYGSPNENFAFHGPTHNKSSLNFMAYMFMKLLELHEFPMKKAASRAKNENTMIILLIMHDIGI